MNESERKYKLKKLEQAEREASRRAALEYQKLFGYKYIDPDQEIVKTEDRHNVNASSLGLFL